MPANSRTSTSWPQFQTELASQGKFLPTYITKEFEEYLKCGRLEHGFLRVRCDTCHDERLVAFSCKRRGFFGSCGPRSMAQVKFMPSIAICPRAALGRKRLLITARGEVPFMPTKRLLSDDQFE